MLDVLFHGLAIGLIAFVYVCILQEPGMILGPVYRFIQDRSSEDISQSWLYKPLFSCERCVAGQMSLWFYLFYIVMYKGGQYDLFRHILLISISIYSVWIYKRIYKWARS